jgi:hypothetical protein
LRRRCLIYHTALVESRRLGIAMRGLTLHYVGVIINRMLLESSRAGLLNAF